MRDVRRFFGMVLTGCLILTFAGVSKAAIIDNNVYAKVSRESSSSPTGWLIFDEDSGPTSASASFDWGTYAASSSCWLTAPSGETDTVRVNLDKDFYNGSGSHPYVDNSSSVQLFFEATQNSTFTFSWDLTYVMTNLSGGASIVFDGGQFAVFMYRYNSGTGTYSDTIISGAYYPFPGYPSDPGTYTGIWPNGPINLTAGNRYLILVNHGGVLSSYPYPQTVTVDGYVALDFNAPVGSLVPLPGSLLLLGTGLLGLGAMGWRRG